MARSRNIKPSLFKNEILGERDPLLTILFTGLWCLADRDGRLEDRPKRIKAEIFPYRELPDFNGYLTELAQLGFIDRYSVAGQAIIQVLAFAAHQSPHKTEKPSELPEKPIKPVSCPVTVSAPLNNQTQTVKESLIPDSLNLIPDSLIPENKPLVSLEESFAVLWNRFDTAFGEKGARKRAFEIFEKIKPNENLFHSMLDAVDCQLENKRQLRAAGQFCENFQHVERWLKNERWTDELIPITAGRQNPGRYQSAAERTEAALDAVFGPKQAEPLEGQFEEISPLEADRDTDPGALRKLAVSTH